VNIRKQRRIKACGLASLLLLIAVLGAAQTNSGGTPATSGASQAMSARYEDLMWQTMVPELGNDSPQISILRVDPKTNATQLLIRTPKKMHVPIHWHSANETHTMIQGTAVFEHEGKREQLGPGRLQLHPGQDAAPGMDFRGVGCLYHGRWHLGRELGRQPAQQN
jgi:quercetin dioxygenase-like cupin family protein